MKVRAILHKIRRMVTPPGNRGSLDTEYRQPNADPSHMNVNSPGHHAGQGSGGGGA
jgi:hypothetical protein